MLFTIEGLDSFTSALGSDEESKLPGNDREKEIKINIRNKFSLYCAYVEHSN